MEPLKLKRVVMEVFGGCNYTCQMCPQSNPGRGKNFTRKMKLDEFEKILDMIVPKYGSPQINLEGSGEPTMAKDLPLYIKAVKKRGLKCFMYCNGARLNGEFMKKVLDAGIDFIRVSVIGYNKEKYRKWMDVDNFELILNNLKEIKDYISLSESKTQLSTYHLITDNSNEAFEIGEYKKNVIDKIKLEKSYIWKMHNWSGNYENKNARSGIQRQSCGRPFAPEVTIRAGGVEGRTSAMVPCCQTLGPPNEEKSILGHLDSQTFEEVYFGKEYEKLRDAHTRKAFDEIDYCKNCDFLYQSEDILAWTNDKEAKLNNMLGTGEDFILTEYNKNKLA
ncbi:radical SAM protein [Candidatus Pelagibacter sp.]|nr:radical SAM protein [Candidatus Pelagibacter sp.]